ncbi:MAG: phosphoribosylglycinamide formyltransferase [Vicingaceae bacterium]
MSKIAIFASGVGTNAEQLIRYFNFSQKENEVSLVLSNKADSGVLEKAKELGVETQVFSNKGFEEGKEVVKCLKEASIEVIVLAGFLRKVSDHILHHFKDRIINIHPSLLPLYGGKGMYGRKVHQAVLENHENQSGISIHLVNEEFDQGKILFQAACKVEKEDTIESLTNKIHQLEHQYFSQVVEDYVIKTIYSEDKIRQ